MIAILGLILLLAASGIAASGVISNTGSAHLLGEEFQVLGLQLSGLSSGQVFLFGIIAGFAGMLGLAMLFGTFNRRMASRRSRRALKGSQRETATAREDSARLTQQLDDQRTEAP
jgi:hypothetical protein